MKQAGVIACAILFLTLTFGQASAALLNGGFELIDGYKDNPSNADADQLLVDFSNWIELGNVYSNLVYPQYGFLDETEGGQAAVLSTSDYANNFSDTDVENFLNLNNGDLSSLVNGEPHNGSTIYQTFSADADDVLVFDWNFYSVVGMNSTKNDSAFFMIDDYLFLLADTYSNLTLLQEYNFWNTGYQSSSFSLTSSGVHTLAFGVLDVNTTDKDSWLLIDNVQVTSPVPIPATMILFGSGLIGLLGLRKKFGRN